MNLPVPSAVKAGKPGDVQSAAWPVRVTSEKQCSAFHSIFLSRFLTSVPSGKVEKLIPCAFCQGMRKDE
jgi:hypothetical protein